MMTYSLIGNVIMAIIALLIYRKYSTFKQHAIAEILDLRDAIDSKHTSEANQNHAEENTNPQTVAVHTNSVEIEAMMREINQLRKEKEDQITLRLQTEKQIELALQKTDAIQKRIDDWQAIQDAVIKDSQDAITKLGNDLYDKMSSEYNQETTENKNLINKITSTISDYFDKFSSTKSAELPSEKSQTPSSKSSSQISKKLTDDLIELIKTNGYIQGRDYFLSSNFSADKAKLMLCEVAFISLNKLYAIDFKSCRYFDEYKTSIDKGTLTQKLEKYFTYLSNPKYKSSIAKAMSDSQSKFESYAVIAVVPTKVDILLIKETGYYDKMRKAGIEIMDFENLNNIVL